jgi:hypothetical protein
MAEVAQIWGLHFPTVLVMFFYKNVLCCILGDFFTTSSGHPETKPKGHQE